MVVEVVHRTALRYDRAIRETAMELRLQPADGAGQRLVEWGLRLEPSAPLGSYRDSFGNVVHYFNYRPPHERVLVEARSVVETATSPVAPRLGRGDDPARFLEFDGPVLDLPEVRALAREHRLARRREAGTLGEGLAALERAIHERFAYRPNATSVASTVADLLATRAGVCQDFAHLWLAVCRAARVPGRYVSGYIVGQGDGLASHAWAEAWIEGLGWRASDPTNPPFNPDAHVKVAVGRAYPDVAPTKGVFTGPAHETIEVSVSTRLLGLRNNAGTTYSSASPSPGTFSPRATDGGSG